MSESTPEFTSEATPEFTPEYYLHQGQRAFESGNYQQAIQLFQQGKTIAQGDKALDGEAQIWLVTAYEATGDREKALELCRVAVRHPHGETRRQAKRLLYILEAPKLQMNRDWLTEIPDLTELDSHDKEARDWGRPMVNLSPPRPLKVKPPEGYVIPEPTDLTNVNVGDDRSILLAVAAAMLVLAIVIWVGLH